MDRRDMEKFGNDYNLEIGPGFCGLGCDTGHTAGDFWSYHTCHL